MPNTLTGVLSGTSSIIRTQSLNVIENGHYTPPTGVDGFDDVTVNVPQSAPVLDDITITENGHYTPPTGVDGYDDITVNVPAPAPVLDDITITENGHYTPPTGVDGYDDITVNVSTDFYFAAENLNIGDTSVYVTVPLDRNVVSGDKYLISVLDRNIINDAVITIDFNNSVNIPLYDGYGQVMFTASTINLYNYAGDYRNIYIRLTKIPDEMEVPNE